MHACLHFMNQLKLYDRSDMQTNSQNIFINVNHVSTSNALGLHSVSYEIPHAVMFVEEFLVMVPSMHGRMVDELVFFNTIKNILFT